VLTAQALRDDVVDVERHAARVGAPGEDGLAEWEPLELGHARFDHEPPAGAEVRRGVLEARDLAVLRGQIEDRVEHQEDEREVAFDARRRHVAGHGVDPLGAGLVAQPRQHRLGVVHAGDAHTALGQRQRDPAGPDRELQRRAVARQLREQVHGRLDQGRVEHAPGEVVVARRDALAEVPLVRSHARSVARTP
jgi:hypothetical protein